MSDALQRIVDDFVRQGGVGIAAGVGLEGVPVIVRFSGVADRVTHVPVGPQHLFRIGSCTKTFVAVVLACLAESGVIDLESPVLSVLPDFPGRTDMTVRMLVNHRSGLPEFEYDIPMNASRRWTPWQIVDFAFALPKRTATAPESQRRAVYSNTGYVLAGLAIEAVTGKSLAQNIRSTILEPLGLHDSWCAATEPYPAERLTRGYYYRPPLLAGAETAVVSGGEMWRTEGLLTYSEGLQDSTALFGADAAYAAGDMVGSAADLACFLQGLFSLRIITRETLDGMLADRWPVSFPGTRMVETGAGLFASRYANRFVFGHQGGMPGFVTLMQHSPDQMRTVAITTNVGSGNRLHLFATAIHDVMDELMSARV